MRAVFAFVTFIGLSSSALADDGETYVDIGLTSEVAWLSHPAVHPADASPFASSAAVTFLPRLSLGARRGITNELHLGLGLEGALFGNLRATGVELSKTPGDLFAGTYAESALPLTVTWRVDSGSDLTALVELHAGPLLTVWANNALADPNNLDANGLPSRLPLEIADIWSLGGMARVGVAFEARLFDVFVVAIEPNVGASWAGTPGFHVGLNVRPSLAFDLSAP